MRLKIESPIVANSLYALNEVVVEKLIQVELFDWHSRSMEISSLRMQPMG
ncbi:MAG: hypothetical protein CM15mP49_08100 [Actinomycetota bacterium]|nr:MAG: hypothetical protein CM15mP49_08100 [Actinomycetota bacterium]